MQIIGNASVGQTKNKDTKIAHVNAMNNVRACLVDFTRNSNRFYQLQVTLKTANSLQRPATASDL